MEINIEIHHNLLPLLPGFPLRPLESLIGATIPFELDGVQALSLGYEDMLWHLYQHGFGMPLSYGAFRFMHAADMITLVEKELEQIDWQTVHTEHPKITNILTPSITYPHGVSEYSRLSNYQLDKSQKEWGNHMQGGHTDTYGVSKKKAVY